MTRLFLAACIVCAGTAWSAQINSLTLQATFDEAAKGRLVSLADAHGQQYVSARNVESALWNVEACRTTDFTQKKIVRADEAKNFFVQKKDDHQLQLVWEDVGVAVARAVATFTAKPDDPAIRCRIAVTPKAGWALVETQFPRFALNECLGTTPTDDAIVMGTGHGGLVRDPMNPNREYWKSRHVGHSPGNLVAQFGSFFDDRGGLFTMAEDADGNEKELLMDRWWRKDRPDGTFWGGDFLFRWSRFEYSETTDEQPYDILLRGFRNPDGEETTWYDAADLYKEWAKKQFWCRKTFLEKTDFLPAWTREAPVVMCFNRRWFDRPEFFRNWLENYWRKNFPDAPLLTILEGWEHHGDWITTEYFPVYPSETAFAEMMGWVKAAGGHPWPWPGGHHWNVQVGAKGDGTFSLDFSKGFWPEVSKHAVLNPDGKVRLDKLVWLGGGNSASMCPGDPWSVDWWNRDIACELVKRGADLVQADQDVGARVPTCWSRTHGHKPGPGRWLMHAQRHQFETMLTEMRKINPDALFSFEEMHEYFNDIYAFCDYRNCRWPGPEWASVWNYLYHEYVPPFQSGSEQYDRWFWLAFCAADGQMPRLPVRPEFYGGEEELFPNGNFENFHADDGRGFIGWEHPERHVAVSEGVPEGRYALRVKTAGKRSQVARSLRIDTFWRKDVVYRVSVRLKGETSDPKNNFDVAAISRVGDKYKSHGGVSFPVPKPEEGWKAFAKEFTIAPGAEQLRFMLNANNGTSFLADDIVFEMKRPDGTFGPVSRMAGELDAVRAFCEKWIRLYRGVGRKWLAHGRALHPPKVECDRIVYHEVFRGTKIDNIKPVVFGTAWEAADGTRALMFVNATPYEQKIAYRWKGVWTRTTMKPRELRLVPVEDHGRDRTPCGPQAEHGRDCTPCGPQAEHGRDRTPCGPQVSQEKVGS